MNDCDVLIVGAGPTGLILALWLNKLGVKFRIIDKATESATTSRALAVQARTLELYRQLDLTDAVLARGHKVPGVNLWARGEKAVRLPFETIGENLTPYSFLEIFPQDEHERLLVDRLKQAGVTVERQTELLHFTQDADGVTAQLSGPGGQQSVRTRYLAGCDGARSCVRETLGTGFPGGTYRQIFYVADVEAAGPPVDGELHVDLDESDFLAIFPLTRSGHVRLVGTVRDERAEHGETLQFEDVSGRAIEHLKVEVRSVNWFSTYHVHHRVTEHFRDGRAFLLGDAAHVHSPAGGQGMNTGIGDAINLAWKLASVLGGKAADSLLDTFEAERIGFARKLVATTDRAFSFATADGMIANLIRTRLAPLAASRLAGLESVREYMFRTVSQITLNYRDSPLSDGLAGQVHGGDRLPWAAADGGDNFGTFGELHWQVHVYGLPGPGLADWCRTHHVGLHVFAWREAHAAAGLARDGLYLLRPDSYVALAEPTGLPQALDTYFADRGIRP